MRVKFALVLMLALGLLGSSLPRRIRGRRRDGDILGASTRIEAGSSLIEPGSTPAAPVTLSWRRFQDAADQAGISRLYGGIHFDEGNVYALDSGKKLGEGAFSLAKKLWEGG